MQQLAEALQGEFKPDTTWPLRTFLMEVYYKQKARAWLPGVCN